MSLAHPVASSAFENTPASLEDWQNDSSGNRSTCIWERRCCLLPGQRLVLSAVRQDVPDTLQHHTVGRGPKLGVIRYTFLVDRDNSSSVLLFFLYMISLYDFKSVN